MVLTNTGMFLLSMIAVGAGIGWVPTLIALRGSLSQAERFRRIQKASRSAAAFGAFLMLMAVAIGLVIGYDNPAAIGFR